MKIWILSYLHLEVVPLAGPLAIPDAGVCVVAGDLCRGVANVVRWLAEHIAPATPASTPLEPRVLQGLDQRGAGGRTARAIRIRQRSLPEAGHGAISNICFLGAAHLTEHRIKNLQRLAMMLGRSSTSDWNAARTCFTGNRSPPLYPFSGNR